MDYTFTIKEEWQSRLVCEFLGLKERTEKLKAALDDEKVMVLFDRAERQRLWEQWETMSQLSAILLERLTINRVLIDPLWIEA